MNKLHVYTGTGKGKTTAAIGLALRSLGHGNTVLIAQFMKTGNSGELKAFSAFPNAVVQVAPPISGFTFSMTEEEKAHAHREQTDFAQSLIEYIPQAKPGMIVLDELAVAISSGLLGDDAARALLDTALQSGETVVTGRSAPSWLLDRADYLSEINAVKHPYSTEKLAARKGIEY